MINTISCTTSANESGTIIKHIATINWTHPLFDSPTITDLDGLQVSTIMEHGNHIGNSRRIERSQIKRSQRRTLHEHASHILYIAGIKVAEVNIRKVRTIVEHIVHRGYISRIQILYI